MEKNFITIEIETLKWTDAAVEIDQAISDLQEAKAKGATHIQVERWVDHDCAMVEIECVQKRFETDEEVQLREAELNAHLAAIKQKELQELARLKKIYEQH